MRFVRKRLGDLKMRKKNEFRLGLESLETRQLMAGQVFATLEGSLMKIEGDNLSNQIAVTQNSVGDVIVSGQNGTRINGLSSVRFARPQLNAMEIRMEGGDDTVAMRGVNLTNDLFVDLGAGNDRLTSPATTPINIGANAAVYGGAGTDTVQLANATVREDLFIEGGLGVLSVNLTGAAVDKAMTIIGDEANDVVSVANSSFGIGLSIETKGGSDRVSLTDVSTFGLMVNTDANAALGADQVTLTRVNVVEDLGVFTGAGNDLVRMTDVTANKVSVSLDNGNDRLIATRVAAATDAIFEGGAGTDILENRGITAGIVRELKEFEIFR
jgi:hypothetical protein